MCKTGGFVKSAKQKQKQENAIRTSHFGDNNSRFRGEDHTHTDCLERKALADLVEKVNDSRSRNESTSTLGSEKQFGEYAEEMRPTDHVE